MRADAFRLEVVLSEKQQWVVPVYQRHYEWETDQDRQIPKLWEDLRDKAIEHLEKRRPYPHYFGAVLYSEPSGQPFGSIRKRYLVDGQQRITTFELVLVAVREVAREAELSAIQNVVSSFLFNEESKGMSDPKRERYKLWPSTYDRSLYRDIADNARDDIRKLQPGSFYKNGNLIKGRAPNLLKAYWFLHEAISAFIDERTEEGETAEQVLDAILAGFLTGFQVVMIHLDENDDAQEIFASLNGMAKPLSPFDLIRNDVFHRARKMGEDDELLFDGRWKFFEHPFWNELVRQGRLKRARADHLITHSVVAETAREVNSGKIAAEYQNYARERAFSTVAEELDVLLVHAKTYRSMEQLSDPVCKRLAHVLQTWDSTTFYPLVMWINAQMLDDEDKETLFSVIETYIIRREICGLTTKNYNKVAVALIRELKEHGASPEVVVRHLSGLSGDASRLPNETEILSACVNQKVYGATPSTRLRYILQQIEYAIRTKFDETTLDTTNLTIEHVMPRKWAEHWPLCDGRFAPCESTIQAITSGHELDEAIRVEMEKRQQHVDTLGNLTLITKALNPSLSNGPWAQKRERLGQSLLVLNRDVACVPNWNEDTIKARGEKLGNVINAIWRAG